MSARGRSDNPPPADAALLRELVQPADARTLYEVAAIYEQHCACRPDTITGARLRALAEREEKRAPAMKRLSDAINELGSALQFGRDAWPLALEVQDAFLALDRGER